MTQPRPNVTLPEGISLQRVAQVLRDAWEAGSHQWTDTPLQLREGRPPAPAATVEGLVVLKLYALPSLYRQMDLDRVALYENDLTMLLARHQPPVEPLLELVTRHVLPTDGRELSKILVECAERAARIRTRTGS